MEIIVLRLGHRLPRDERISTHVALVARAFGANSIVYTGQHDEGLESSVLRLADNWGKKTVSGSGPSSSAELGGAEAAASGFSVSYEKSPVSFIKKKKKDGFAIMHLTMYGLPIKDALPKLKTQDTKLVIIVGSEQVPREIYELADYNISITNQPHSEVAALAIALDRLMEGKELEGFDFQGRLKIKPSAKGKKFENLKP